jgi:hypothetical protein
VGYSHSWRRPKKFPTRKFLRAKDDCRKVCKYLMGHRELVLCEEYDKPMKPPVFDRYEICFNGPGDPTQGGDGYETFSLSQENDDGWFCKTNHKPYDLAVCCCLIVFAEHFKNKFVVTSDGDDDEENWPLAREICQEVLGYGKNFELANRDIGRLSVRDGMPIGEVDSSSGYKVYVLANGMAMRAYPAGRSWELHRFRHLCGHISRRDRALVFEDRYYAHRLESVKLVLSAPTRLAAQWGVMHKWLKETFGQGLDAESFLQQFADTCDWNVLLVWVDRLAGEGTDQDKRLARRLLRALPAKVVTGKRACLEQVL